MRVGLFGVIGGGIAAVMLALPKHAMAVRIELDVCQRLTAFAEYRVDSPKKPAAVILEGMMRMHESSIAFRKLKRFTGLIFTRLAPTHSLGATYRKPVWAAKPSMPSKNLIGWTTWIRN